MRGIEAVEVSLELSRQRILDRVSIRLRPGEMLGLIGPNGAGKSCLLKLLGGILTPAAGRISMDEVPLRAIAAVERARALAYLSQDANAYWPLLVERIVALGRIPHLGTWQRPDATDAASIRKAMAQTNVQTLAKRSFPTLSGGEKARVLLARALAVEPRYLLADEPVAALDPAHQLEVMELLRARCTGGTGVLVVLHDLRLAAHYCDRLQLLHQGRTLAQGSPQEVLSAPNLEQAYGIRLRHRGPDVHAAFALSWERLK